MTEKITVADYLFKRLSQLGVNQVFALPGGGSMHLIDALARSEAIETVCCHHEQAVGIAAEAWGRVADPGFGVAVVTTGPGGTNLATPVLGAWIDSIPMLIISGQVKRADLLHGRPLRQTGVQEVDVVTLFKPFTKYSITIETPESAPEILEEAIFQMRNGRPGPVWIDVPLDVQASKIDPAAIKPSFVAPEIRIPPLDKPLDRIVELLKDSERPLLLAGHGIHLAGAADLWRKLVETLDIPAVSTWNALDLLPFEHPLNVGRCGVTALRAPNFAIQNCDLLITVGTRLDNVVTAFNCKKFARNAKKVLVDIDANELDRIECDSELKIAVDAAVFLKAILQRAETFSLKDLSAWRHRCVEWKDRYAYENRPQETVDSPDFIPALNFISAISDLLPEDQSISVGSSGLAIEMFFTHFRNKKGQRIFLTSGLGSMGYGLPAAIGTCCGRKRQPTVAFESDGSFDMNIQDLATLAALKLPLCLFVMNNSGYASIRNMQRNYFQGRYLGTGPEGGTYFPDICRIADAYELASMRIENTAELRRDLETALQLPRPCLIDVRLVPNEALFPKSMAIPQSDGSMISMPMEDMSPLLTLEQLQAEMLVPLCKESLEARSESSPS